MIRLARAVAASAALLTLATAVSRAQAAPLTGSWVSQGPTSIQRYYQSAYVSGRVNGVAVTPSGTVYAATSGGGVWISRVGSSTWRLAPNEPAVADAAIALDPANPNVLYVATGPDTQMTSSGLLESTDGGQTWTTLGGSVFTGHHLYTVAVDPGNPSLILVGGDLGLELSDNGGLTWTSVLSAPVRNVAIASGTPNVMYAGVTGVGVEESTDGGQTWTTLTGGLPAPSSSIGTVNVAVAPSDPQVVYADMAQAGGSNDGQLLGMFVSRDGGQSWQTLSGLPNFTLGYDLNYASILTVSPTNPDAVYAGSIYLIKSTDGGKRWITVSPVQPLHIDLHGAAWTASGDLYIGNDGGVYNVTPTGTIVDLNGNLDITQVYQVAFNPGGGLVIGTQDNGIDVGQGTDWLNVVTGDVYGVAVLAKNDFIETDDTYVERAVLSGKSNRRWWMVQPGGPPSSAPITWLPSRATWTVQPSGWSAFDDPIIRLPSTHTVLVGGPGTSYLWRSVNSGQTWSRASLPVPKDDFITALAVAPSSPQVVYAALGGALIYLSTNGGVTWTPVATVNALNGQDSWPTSIAVSPSDPYAIAVSMAYTNFPLGPDTPNVYLDPNTQSTTPDWTDATGNLPANAGGVRSLLYDGSTLLAGTDTDLYATDGDGEWSPAGVGFPAGVPVMSLALSPNGVVAAGTFGRGVFELTPTASGQ